MTSLLTIKDIAGLGKPLQKLIAAVDEHVGAELEPRRIRRRAQAEADAARVIADGEAAAMEIRVRAARRVAAEDLRHQQNLESIINRAANHLPETVSDQAPDPDWVSAFMDAAKHTSNPDVQELWSRLLAGEVSAPGQFSRRLIYIVQTMDSEYARSFAKLSRFSLNNRSQLVVFHQDPSFQAHGPSFDEMQELDALGLIRFDPGNGFAIGTKPVPKDNLLLAEFDYDGTALAVDLRGVFPNEDGTVPPPVVRRGACVLYPPLHGRTVAPDVRVRGRGHPDDSRGLKRVPQKGWTIEWPGLPYFSRPAFSSVCLHQRRQPLFRPR